MRTGPLLLILTFVFLSSCRNVKEPEYRGFYNLAIGGIGKESLIHLDLEYFNPNKFGVKVKDVEFDVYLDSELLGHAIMDSVIRIPALNTFQIPVNLKTETRVLLKNSLAILLNKEVLLKVEGSARVGKAGVFVKYPLRYEGKHKLQ